MKKQLLTMLSVALIFSIPILGCSADALPTPTDDPCNCERVTYIEAKYQDQTSEEWLLAYDETEREPVDCQTETDYSIPETGSTERVVHRIECE